ncbi:MAG: 2-succinyl-6-hydroxy-2,4-cyclohexadiene-1-carboxylate synthase [Bacillota bacterium]|nr:2-succinyl-6-hydroxy-2,4-cyclohexadiene-1-carboxylate synthase [Bacillota bacterium]
MSAGGSQTVPLRHRFLTRKGVRLHWEVAGPLEGSAPALGPAGSGGAGDQGGKPGGPRPLVLLHGFTGRAAVWRPLLPELARRRRVVAVDLLGHGRSRTVAGRPQPERYRMEAQAEDLLAILDRMGLERVDLLGYSMGGRVALHLALHVPERLGALVLESASPGLASAQERAARVAHDEALAAFLEAAGIRAFVDRWEALPLFATHRRLPRRVWQRQRRLRLLNRPAELAASLRGMGTGAQAPLWDRLARLAVPTRLVVGERDAKFVALARQMAARSPQIQVVTVPGAGHTVHLEQPEAFLQAVLPFLEAHGAEAGGQGAGGQGDRALAEAGPGG